MSRTCKSAFLVLICAACGCLANAGAAELQRLDGSTVSLELMDAIVNEAMHAREVPGLGLAFVHDGRVSFAKS